MDLWTRIQRAYEEANSLLRTGLTTAEVGALAGKLNEHELKALTLIQDTGSTKIQHSDPTAASMMTHFYLSRVEGLAQRGLVVMKGLKLTPLGQRVSDIAVEKAAPVERPTKA